MIITIDGTSASGKGTLTKRLAEYYCLPHMDTGLLYRAVAYKARQLGILLSNEPGLVEIASKLNLEAFAGRELRTQVISDGASTVSAIPASRAALIDAQKNFCLPGMDAIMDGRDIGTVICQHADVKLWLDADPVVRATRRFEELQFHGEEVPLSVVIEQMKTRDQRDATRANAPMMPSENTMHIDTSHMTADAVFNRAVEIVEASGVVTRLG